MTPMKDLNRIVTELRKYATVRGGPIMIKFTKQTFFDSIGINKEDGDVALGKLRKARFDAMMLMAQTPKNGKTIYDLKRIRQTENEEFNNWMKEHISRNTSGKLTDDQWYDIYKEVFQDFRKHFISPRGTGWGSTIVFVHGNTEGIRTKERVTSLMF